MIRRLTRAVAAPLAVGLLAIALSGCVVVPVPQARFGGTVVVGPGYGDGPPPPPRYRRDWRHGDGRY